LELLAEPDPDPDPLPALPQPPPEPQPGRSLPRGLPPLLPLLLPLLPLLLGLLPLLPPPLVSPALLLRPPSPNSVLMLRLGRFAFAAFAASA
jgi:hypothetical protein